MVIELSAEKLEIVRTQVCRHDLEIEFTKPRHDSIWEKIVIFSEEMSARNQSTDLWEKKRNAAKPDEDNRLGKYSEYAASLILHNVGFPLIEPDMEVRGRHEKNWDADLPYSIKGSNFPNCHVKGCNQMTSNLLEYYEVKSQYSWTFQWRNNDRKGGKDDLFRNLDCTDVVLFMFVPDFVCKKAILVASAPWCKIHSLLQDPAKIDYFGLKKCINSGDLFALPDIVHKPFGDVHVVI